MAANPDYCIKSADSLNRQWLMAISVVKVRVNGPAKALPQQDGVVTKVPTMAPLDGMIGRRAPTICLLHTCLPQLPQFK